MAGADDGGGAATPAGLEDGEIQAQGATADPAKSPDGNANGEDPAWKARIAGLSKEEKKRLKKKRKRIKAGRGDTADYYDVYGPNARASVALAEACPKRIRIRDVQGLVLWMLAEAVNPTWVFIKNKPLVHKVVLVHACGGSAGGSLASCFPEGKCVRVPSLALNSAIRPHSTTNSVLTVPHRHKRTYSVDLIAHRYGTTPPYLAVSPSKGASPAARKGTNLPSGMPQADEKEHTPACFALSEEDLGTNGYPRDATGGFVRTQPRARSADAGSHPTPEGVDRLVAVDCEMCQTTEGLALTRVTVVDDVSTVLYDALVKPAAPITDYLTPFSGITAAMLAGVDRTMEEARARVLELIDETTYVVGHSLENDLNALRIVVSSFPSLPFPCIMTAPTAP